MDTLRDKRELETLWAEGQAPWNVWSTPNSENSSGIGRLQAA